MNFTTTHIRSEKVTIDTRIYTILNGRKKPGEVYLAAIAPDMELTVITLDEVSDILPCFDESDSPSTLQTPRCCSAITRRRFSSLLASGI